MRKTALVELLVTCCSQEISVGIDTLLTKLVPNYVNTKSKTGIVSLVQNLKLAFTESREKS